MSRNGYQQVVKIHSERQYTLQLYITIIQYNYTIQLYITIIHYNSCIIVSVPIMQHWILRCAT